MFEIYDGKVNILIQFTQSLINGQTQETCDVSGNTLASRSRENLEKYFIRKLIKYIA